MFIKQSVRSDYCLVYATAMLLTLSGDSVDRRGAQRLFGLPKRSRYGGARHDEASEVLRARGASHVRWYDMAAPVTFARFAASISRAISASTGPVLVTFGATHRRLGLRCYHAAVAIHADSHGIELLDPLGSPPVRARGNVTVEPAERRGMRSITKGTVYRVDLGRRVSVLHWKPPGCWRPAP